MAIDHARTQVLTPWSIAGGLKRVTVAWCRSCHWWLEAAQLGTPCPARDCTYHLTRRVGYVCPNAWCQWLHRTQRAVKECDCGDSIA